MGVKVVKFGGSSLADADQFRKVQAIIKADNQRRYVVPSAPGKRNSADQKITDLLYLCHAHAQHGIAFDDVFQLICNRYLEIVEKLGLKLDLHPYMKEIKEKITSGATADYAASRGEYLNGLIMADLLGWDFIDPVEVIFFDQKGLFDSARTQDVISGRLAKHEHAVIPGFFGSMPNGEVKTFSRGGSDITGAIVARGVGADLYENWTDVSGFLMADPRIVKNPKSIERITYRELRELAYMGASVLHEETIFPVREAGIPVNIKNTNAPEDPGTLIVTDKAAQQTLGGITGIAGKKDFTVLTIEKALMNMERGFGRNVLSILERNGISFEHMPSGIDTISLVIADTQLDHKLDKVIDEIKRECQPDTIEVSPNMALIATVGLGMAYTPGVAAKLFTALAESNVNVRMIDQGSSEINIIVGVENDQFEKAVCAIYEAFVK